MMWGKVSHSSVLSYGKEAGKMPVWNVMKSCREIKLSYKLIKLRRAREVGSRALPLELIGILTIIFTYGEHYACLVSAKRSLIAAASLFTPSLMLSSSINEKFTRRVFWPVPSQKNASPITKATLFLMA